MVAQIAREIDMRIRERQVQERKFVLGLATGSTPVPLYRELVRRHLEEGLSFKNVVTFNLDEYEGLQEEDPQSYHIFMQKHLFEKVDLDPKKVFLPPGNYENPTLAARTYENEISSHGGIDFQILGIGRDGHIGFNEPGSSESSRTRRVILARETREDAAEDFGGILNVPTHAMTMGLGTILEARKIVLMAWGEKKAKIVQKAMSGSVGRELPASFLQNHWNTGWYLDDAAASEWTNHQAS
jgi:glucosamine-6-phosphate deaminase